MFLEHARGKIEGCENRNLTRRKRSLTSCADVGNDPDDDEECDPQLCLTNHVGDYFRMKWVHSEKRGGNERRRQRHHEQCETEQSHRDKSVQNDVRQMKRKRRAMTQCPLHGKSYDRERAIKRRAFIGWPIGLTKHSPNFVQRMNAIVFDDDVNVVECESVL